MATQLGPDAVAQPAVTSLNEKTDVNGTLLHPTESSSSASSFHSATSTVQEPADNTGASSQTTDSAGTASADDWRPASWTTGPLTVPITRPVARAKTPAIPKLTDEQNIKYKTVLDAVKEWQTIPSTTVKNAPQVPLQDHERMWLTRECILRYLRASKWITRNALTRLQSTLSWRREYGADEFTHDYISPENETGKQCQLGYDLERKPVLYLNPAKQNTKMSDRQIHHLCYMLDRTVDMMPPGQEKTCLVINFKGASSGAVPTMGQARAVLNILQNHNPERLGRALISETPWYVTTFFKVISPFIDPVTKEKIKFNEDFRKYIPAEQLWDHHGGDLKFEYEHEKYWPAFDKDCSSARAGIKERWEKGGKRIGEYEGYLLGGNHPSLMEEEKQNEATQSKASSTVDQATEGATEGVSKLAV